MNGDEMELHSDAATFDKLQIALIKGLVEDIKRELDGANLPKQQVRKLVEQIAFSIAAILDNSRTVEDDGVEVCPLITFEIAENVLVYPAGNSWMHEYVFRVVEQIYRD